MALFSPNNSDSSDDSDNSLQKLLRYIYSVFVYSVKGDKPQWAYWVGELKVAINMFTP